MWTFFKKVFIEFGTILLLFMFWFFGHKACGVLPPRPGIEPTPPRTGRQSLNHWTAREVPNNCSFFFCILFIFLYSKFLLVIYFIHVGVYMSIPISQFIPPPPPPATPLSPLGVHTFVLYICVSISALQTSSSVPFF